MTLRSTCSSLVLSLILAFAGSLSADVSVQSRFGDVRVQRKGSAAWEMVQVGTKLSPYDTVQTGTKSGAMLFLSGSENIVSIEANSRIVVTESMGSSGTKKPGFTLFVGKMKSRLAKGAAGAEEFATTTAVVGVRGTEFIVAVADDGTTQVGVLRGEVQVAGQNGAVALASNQSSLVPLAGAPADKTAFTGNEDWTAWLQQQSSSIKGRESQILDSVAKALDYNYGLMDGVEQKKNESRTRIEELKKILAEARETKNEERIRAAGDEISTLINTSSRLIIEGQNLDLRNQALLAVAERVKNSNPKLNDLASAYITIKKKFDTYHKRYMVVRENNKKSCLGR